MKKSEQLLELRRREMVETLKRYGIANQRELDAYLDVLYSMYNFRITGLEGQTFNNIVLRK